MKKMDFKKHFSFMAGVLLTGSLMASGIEGSYSGKDLNTGKACSVDIQSGASGFTVSITSGGDSRSASFSEGKLGSFYAKNFQQGGRAIASNPSRHKMFGLGGNAYLHFNNSGALKIAEINGNSSSVDCYSLRKQ